MAMDETDPSSKGAIRLRIQCPVSIDADLSELWVVEVPPDEDETPIGWISLDISGELATPRTDGSFFIPSTPRAAVSELSWPLTLEQLAFWHRPLATLAIRRLANCIPCMCGDALPAEHAAGQYLNRAEAMCGHLDREIRLRPECDCRYRVATHPPDGWQEYRRQKPMIVYDPRDGDEPVFVLSERLFGFVA